MLVPDKLMAREIAGGQFAPEMNERQQRRTPGLKQLRERLRDPTTRACYARRKALVEPVFGVQTPKGNAEVSLPQPPSSRNRVDFVHHRI